MSTLCLGVFLQPRWPREDATAALRAASHAEDLGFDRDQAATLDVISGGRLILGVGTGWNPEESDALGISSKERGARTDDHLAAATFLTPPGIPAVTSPPGRPLRRRRAHRRERPRRPRPSSRVRYDDLHPVAPNRRRARGKGDGVGRG